MKFVDIIDGYEVVERIAECVYKVRKEEQYFALHCVRTAEMNSYYAQVIEDDIKNAMCLKHPHIRKVIDFAKTGEQISYIENYLENPVSIFDIVRGEGPAEEARVLEMIQQIASALDYASRFQIIHGWLTPHKILFSSGKAYISLSEPFQKRKENMVMGNPRYASPEQVKGVDWGVQSDIFSLGSISYYMMTGKAPFDEKSAMELILSILKENPKAVHKLNSKISRKTSRILQKMMAKKLSKRYQNHAELLNDLL